MKKILLVSVSWVLIISVYAQKELTMPVIPATRVLHHENINNSLTTALKTQVTRNDTLNKSISLSIRTLVNNMRADVELNESLDNNAKFKWLRGIHEMLGNFVSGYNTRTIKGALLPSLVKAYDDAMKLAINDKSILPVISDNDMAVGKILIANYALSDNEGTRTAKDMLVLKECQKDPNSVLKILTKYPENSYADSLIILVAQRDQDELYNYASAQNDLGKKIRSVNHPLVQAIAKMAAMKTGRMYFPFLDDIYRGQISMEAIAPLIANENSNDYYSLLVKTRIGYATRIQNRDTPMAAQALINKLQSKAIELYVNEINALHDQSNPSIRFRKLDALSAQELYYLAVLSEDEIYTSSFVSGVYPYIMKRLRKAKSDTLLEMVSNDYYRKFIKMCASYNTLDNFLRKMDESTAQAMMRNFVNDLEKTRSLEDAVDVADSYGSIYDKDIRRLILNQVQFKLNESQTNQNKRGQNIYHLLNTIFQSMDSAKKVNITAELGINPIYTMPSSMLTDTSKRVIVQQFFYGDKDGKTYFDVFVNQFRNNPNWKIIKTQNWMEVRSVKGTPVSIYSNLPLEEKQDLDTKSQEALIEYLANNELEPSIIIHRGHSYHLKSTISKLPRSGKVILVGSCGGYQNLNQVLDICPNAHIISSKQVGTGVINQGMINLITENLRLGKDLNWPSIWASLGNKFTGDTEEKFDDYVPPYKNLGAIFITAYNRVDN